ncbi:hypothetical protein JVU11DRAFT_8383 [Chiua virens]|nr:hypothetical protein JVU11DRAFT_8383 [Chiua virens]
MSPSTEVCEQDNGGKRDPEGVSEGEPSPDQPRSPDIPLPAEVHKPLHCDPIPNELHPADWLGNIFSNVERKYAEMQARLNENTGSASITTSGQECKAGLKGTDKNGLVDLARVEIFLEMVESSANLVSFPPGIVGSASEEFGRRWMARRRGRIPGPRPEDEIDNEPAGDEETHSDHEGTSGHETGDEPDEN